MLDVLLVSRKAAWAASVAVVRVPPHSLAPLPACLLALSTRTATRLPPACSIILEKLEAQGTALTALSDGMKKMADVQEAQGTTLTALSDGMKKMADAQEAQGKALTARGTALNALGKALTGQGQLVGGLAGRLVRSERVHCGLDKQYRPEKLASSGAAAAAAGGAAGAAAAVGGMCQLPVCREDLPACGCTTASMATRGIAMQQTVLHRMVLCSLLVHRSPSSSVTACTPAPPPPCCVVDDLLGICSVLGFPAFKEPLLEAFVHEDCACINNNNYPALPCGTC